MKRILLTLTAGLAVLLSACGAPGGTGDPSPSAGASGSVPASSAPTPSAPADSGNPFETAGIEDPEAFRAMFEEVKKAAAEGDKETVARHALYPILVNAGKVSVKIEDKEELISQYDRIFTPNVLKALAAQDAGDLFVNWKGVMAGNGEIWFGATNEKPQRYGIITVNAGVAR